MISIHLTPMKMFRKIIVSRYEMGFKTRYRWLSLDIGSLAGGILNLIYSWPEFRIF